MYVVKVRWKEWILENEEKNSWSGVEMVTVYVVLKADNELSAVRRTLYEFETKIPPCQDKRVELKSIEVESWKKFDNDIIEAYDGMFATR